MVSPSIIDDQAFYLARLFNFNHYASLLASIVASKSTYSSCAWYSRLLGQWQD